jgi:GNAT superfamily N-acetyltransferase
MEKHYFLTKRIKYSIDKISLFNTDNSYGKLYFKNIDNNELIKISNKFDLSLCDRFWSNCDDVKKNSFGVILKYNFDVIGICYAASISNHKAEVDIIIDKKYRGLGLSKIIFSYFYKNIIKYGIYPTWDCYSNNAESCKLAESLGFRKIKEYDFCVLKLMELVKGK